MRMAMCWLALWPLYIQKALRSATSPCLARMVFTLDSQPLEMRVDLTFSRSGFGLKQHCLSKSTIASLTSPSSSFSSALHNRVCAERVCSVCEEGEGTDLKRCRMEKT